MTSPSFSQYPPLSVLCANTYISAVFYGSICFLSGAVKDIVPTNIISKTSIELKENMPKTYSIGSTVNRDF